MNYEGSLKPRICVESVLHRCQEDMQSMLRTSISFNPALWPYGNPRLEVSKIPQTGVVALQFSIAAPALALPHTLLPVAVQIGVAMAVVIISSHGRISD